MFNNKINKDRNPVTVSNIIGQGSNLEGNISATGNIRIEGKITGGIQTKAKAVLSHTAQVQGNIFAQNAEIGGEVRGTIEVVELLVLKSTAVVFGDIIASKLVFEEGACFDGKCKMGKNKPQQNEPVTPDASLYDTSYDAKHFLSEEDPIEDVANMGK
ncbi:bactofilin family protein [Cardinium endosymbiont of Culicoides punctatus]|uniref:bactofilin family protein n=1 Tax=Cardinium endosymbiont of Culicoides punctatus TaxID=2304601 RepID=UPI0010584988|nr:polymer-forming cytoskeletal protein [Cardinium endosymbiont of Culicoides punctatus]TDG95167.1 hypothetical protein CCPUN_05860 [Cardinium endosymbiont of Culicoides punctatus]